MVTRSYMNGPPRTTFQIGHRNFGVEIIWFLLFFDARFTPHNSALLKQIEMRALRYTRMDDDGDYVLKSYPYMTTL